MHGQKTAGTISGGVLLRPEPGETSVAAAGGNGRDGKVNGGTVADGHVGLCESPVILASPAKIQNE